MTFACKLVSILVFQFINSFFPFQQTKMMDDKDDKQDNVVLADRYCFEFGEPALREGATRLAVEYLDKCLLLVPTHAKALMYKALALEEDPSFGPDRYDQALKNANLAATHLKSIEIQLLRARLMSKLENHADSLAICVSILVDWPECIPALYLSMLNHREMRRYDEQLILCKRLVLALPSSIMYHKHLAQCYQALHLHEEEIKALDEAIRLEKLKGSQQRPVFGQLELSRAQARILTGVPSHLWMAVNELADSFRSRRPDFVVCYELAAAYHQLEKPEKELYYLKEALHHATLKSDQGRILECNRHIALLTKSRSRSLDQRNQSRSRHKRSLSPTRINQERSRSRSKSRSKSRSRSKSTSSNDLTGLNLLDQGEELKATDEKKTTWLSLDCDQLAKEFLALGNGQEWIKYAQIIVNEKINGSLLHTILYKSDKRDEILQESFNMNNLHRLKLVGHFNK